MALRSQLEPIPLPLPGPAPTLPGKKPVLVKGWKEAAARSLAATSAGVTEQRGVVAPAFTPVASTLH